MRMLPGIVLAVAVVHLAPAFAQGRKDPVAPPAVQQEFNAFMTKFRAALKSNDAAAVAGMTRYPFEDGEAIRDAAQFRAKAYKRNFTAENRACIQRGKAVYARDQLNNETYSIFCGELGFFFTKTSSGFLFTEVAMND